MTAHLKSKIDSRKSILKSYEAERLRYRSILYQHPENRSVYVLKIKTLDLQILKLEEEIRKLDKEYAETQFTQIFKNYKPTGLELRDNSR